MGNHNRGEVQDSVPQSLGYKLRRLQLSYNRYCSQAAPQGTIPMRQLGSLALIFRNPGLTPGELKDLLLLDAAQLSLILVSLERRSLIRRVRSTLDSRSYHLHVTEKGADEYRRQQQAIRQIEDNFVRDILDDDERACLLELLDRLLVRREG